MDPAGAMQSKQVLDYHGNMLGNHQTVLDTISNQLVSVTTTLSKLTAENQPAPSSPGDRLSGSLPILPTREPRLPPPESYAGDPGSCQSFLTPCCLIFSLQPSMFPSDEAKVAYVITLLTRKGP